MGGGGGGNGGYCGLRQMANPQQWKKLVKYGGMPPPLLEEFSLLREVSYTPMYSYISGSNIIGAYALFDCSAV